MDEYVVARPGLGDVLQADPLADAAEIDLAHQQAVLAVRLDHLAGYSQAHGLLLSALLALRRG